MNDINSKNWQAVPEIMSDKFKHDSITKKKLKIYEDNYFLNGKSRKLENFSCHMLSKLAYMADDGLIGKR